MGSADAYGYFAEECLRWAQGSRDEEQQQLFLAMARTWSRVAREKNGHTTEGKHPLTYYDPGK